MKIAGKNQQAICQVEGEIESLSQELAGMFGGNVRDAYCIDGANTKIENVLSSLVRPVLKLVELCSQ